MAQYGSNPGMFSQSVVQTVDAQGNPIISADSTFGGSPAGSALLTQQLFGLPNASFDLIPNDPLSPISNSNQVPYWDFANYSDGVMAGSAVYNTTTKNWGVTIYPGTAASGSYVAFTTRSYLINDDNLGLRQKVFAVIEKTGTAAGTTQVNMTLSATYYDSTDTALSTAIVGTALDTGTWTSLSGFTTSGGSAISASAHYVDLQFLVTATANITGSVNFGIKSCLLATKVAALSAFQVVDVYTSSGTWTVPSGVTSVSVVAMGCGGGGGSGGAYREAGAATVNGGGGGGAGGFVIAQGVSVAGSTSITIGVGTGGLGGGRVDAGGTGSAGSAGADGSSSTFGSLVVATGGSGGTGGGIVTPAGVAPGGIGGAGGIPTYATLGASAYTGGTGGNGNRYTTVAVAGGAGATGFTQIPLYGAITLTSGAAGGTATITQGTATFRGTVGAGGTAGIYGGGGGGGGFYSGGANTMFNAGAGGAGGGGGGGVGVTSSATNGQGTAGNGGNAGTTSAGGGGGGGGYGQPGGSGSRNGIVSGSGGNGGSGGFVVIGYIA